MAGYNSDTERELFAVVGAVHHDRPRRDEAHKIKGAPLAQTQLTALRTWLRAVRPLRQHFPFA
jgi:hypothetical protein